jgi:hypothetical protein
VVSSVTHKIAVQALLTLHGVRAKLNGTQAGERAVVVMSGGICPAVAENLPHEHTRWRAGSRDNINRRNGRHIGRLDGYSRAEGTLRKKKLALEKEAATIEYETRGWL